ncbi:MAG: class I SAM-dependent methyltransferase [Actinomycetota bacterium]
MGGSAKRDEYAVSALTRANDYFRTEMGRHADAVDALLDAADRQPFSGWDFSWLEGRIDSQPLPWDYTAAVEELAPASPDLLDLGTGGGEWLSGLLTLPPRTVATEAWPPNVEVARVRLTPLGVHLIQVSPARHNSGKPREEATSRLPIADRSFHLVACRHESFEPTELARILVRGGWFVTQQVDVGNDDDYRRLLGSPLGTFDPAKKWEAWLPDQLSEVGFEVVEYRSASLVQTIRDVGALAWNLKAIPWMVPGFSIAAYRERLRQVQERIEREGPIVVNQRRFWVRARKIRA